MTQQPLHFDSFNWILGSLCSLLKVPYAEDLVRQQFPPPYTTDALIHAARELGLTAAIVGLDQARALQRQATQGEGPYFVAFERIPEGEPADGGRFAGVRLIGKVDAQRVVYFEPGSPNAHIVPADAFAAGVEPIFIGFAKHAARLQEELATAVTTPAVASVTTSRFGYAWFGRELLRHKRIWRDVLIASLAIQLMALATPLFTQVVIDKVVVHHTRSTLIAVGVGLFMFMVFSALLTWIRQYLVLHTGNRVDAVLGSAVFAHLFALPQRYFEHRSTGVIAARLHGVETVREFIASTAVTLLLDLPFLVVFLAIMFWYSVALTLIALAVVVAIAALSLVMAPLFRARLNDQFLLGARNQAFLTEYIAGMETVKSLQMEPQLNATYRDYLATYLKAGFGVKQIGNGYNVASGLLDQLMTLAILIVGAHLVMTEPGFSIGMLVAFQMFAGRVSQPILRTVGLWQQFQQANIAVRRLGDILDVHVEPASVVPRRVREKEAASRIEIEGLAFRHSEDLPFLYEGLDLTMEPNKVYAIVGPSGSGKSTLTKLLLGFYTPTRGSIRIDGVDIRHLPANELRSHFGVVPQETTLFSGTVFQNIHFANPHATLDDVVEACRMAEIHDFIEALPNGYQTEIGERGVGLSGGQKQRLAIARALLKQPRVLIFDEATSNLDPVTAERIAATISGLTHFATLIFIAHALPARLQTDAQICLRDVPNRSNNWRKHESGLI